MAFIGKESVTVTSLDSAESMSVVTDLTVDTNTLKVDSASNRVGILNATPGVSLDIGSATDAIHIPVGTTAERPGSPTSGLFRYNTSLNQFEGYTSTWGAIGGGGTNTFTHDSFTGDDTTTDFVLSQATESENNLFVFIDGVFQTQDAYSISTNSGVTTLSLSAAPLLDRKIIVYTVAAGVSGNNLNQNLFDANTTDAVDGVNTAFTLSIPPVNKNNTQVFFDGVYQHKANYSISGSVLTFTDAPPLGVIVEVMIFTQTAVNVPVDNSVTSAKLSGDLVAPGNLTVTGYLAGPATFIIDPAAVGDNTGTLLVKGDLQVDGTQTIINSTTLTIDDLNITVASGAANALAADGAGITVDTGTDPDATITYDGVNDEWDFNKNVNVTGTVTASADVTISNGNNRFVASSTSAGDYVRMYGGGGTGKWDIYGHGANLRIGDNETAGLVQIDTNLYTVGNVGIGTNSPSAPLNISTTYASDTTEQFRIQDNTGGKLDFFGYANGGKGIQAYEDDGSTFYNLNLNPLGGNVGIGTSSFNATYDPRLQVTSAANDGTGGVLIQNYLPTLTLEDISGGAAVSQIQQDQTSMVFKNNGAERMRIDAGGSVLIGKTTPTDLHNTWNHIIIGEKGAIISQNGAGGIDGIWLADNAYIDSDTGTFAYQTTGEASLIRQSGGVIQFSTAASGSPGDGLTPIQTMAINADRKVDVGGVANQTAAVLNARFNGAAIEFGHGNNSAGYYGTAGSYGNNGEPYIGFSCDAEESVNTFTTRGAKGNIITGDLSGNLTFAQVTNANATGQTPVNRMTLDSSGDLIVSGTAAGQATSVALHNTGYIHAVTSQQQAAVFDRRDSFGTLVIFRKDDAGFGGISVVDSDPTGGGGELLVASGNTGLKFDDQANYIRPSNAVGDLRDNIIDLGNSSNRFKDLYLSGFVSGGGNTGLTTRAVVNGGVTALRLQQARGSVTSPTVSNFNGDGNYITSEVYDGAAFNKIAHIGMVTGTSLDDGDILFATAKAGSTTTKMTLDEDGNLGIGVSPLQKLHVSGSVYASGYYITALQGNAQLTNASTSSGSNPSYIGQGLISVTISDAKAKENFGPVEENECLNKVVSLAEHVKKFDWIDEDWKKEKGRTVGMVAQEIYENHSEFVHKPENYNDDGWAIRHQEMVPTLIKAIQEQQATIEALTARIAALEE